MRRLTRITALLCAALCTAVLGAQSAAAFSPGAYWTTLRWTPSGDHVTICFANHSDKPFQNAVQQWGAANDLQAPYEGGPNACDGYNNQHRVDIYNGTAPLDSRGCTYTFFTATSDDHVARMILYTSPHPDCWNDAPNIYAEVLARGIGTTLGHRLYSTSNPEISIMRTDLCPQVGGWCVSAPQSNDLLTFDWFNG